jgi:hypothetical protein
MPRKAAKCEQAILTYRNAGDACIGVHVLAVLQWLTEEPLRTLTSDALRKWMDQQSPPWSDGYRRIIRQKVDETIAASQGASAEQVKSRLMQLIDQLLPTCQELVMGTAVGGGTMIMTDPDTGKRLTKYNHQAVQGYMKLIGELTGAIASKNTLELHKHQHLHVARGQDLSGIPDDKLDEMIEAEKKELLRLEHEPMPARVLDQPEE